MTQYYSQYVKLFFTLDNSFVSWLIDFLRKYAQNQKDIKFILAMEYFSETKIQDHERLYHLLQFLNFIQTLKNEDCSQYFLEGQRYFIYNFPLKDFRNFIGIKQNPNQRLNILEYFRQFHKLNPIIEQFEDETFRIFTTFLHSSIYTKSNRGFILVYIIEDLNQYVYQFLLSKL